MMVSISCFHAQNCGERSPGVDKMRDMAAHGFDGTLICS